MSVVLISVVAVITYRLFITFEYCSSMSAIECLITSSLISAILNAVSILILGKVMKYWKKSGRQILIEFLWSNQKSHYITLKLFHFSFMKSLHSNSQNGVSLINAWLNVYSVNYTRYISMMKPYFIDRESQDSDSIWWCLSHQDVCFPVCQQLCFLFLHCILQRGMLLLSTDQFSSLFLRF